MGAAGSLRSGRRFVAVDRLKRSAKKMWPIKLFLVLLRNQFILKPKARRAARVVKANLEAEGFSHQSVMLGLGLAEAKELSCSIVLKSDSDLRQFEESELLATITRNFREELLASNFPQDATPYVTVDVHSEEEIERAGGYYNYFN